MCTTLYPIHYYIDTVVHIWRLNSDDPSSVGVVGNLVSGSSDASPSKNKENWSVVKLLRGHLEDIYDICWSPDSLCLVSGSVDNSAIVWDVNKGGGVLFRLGGFGVCPSHIFLI